MDITKNIYTIFNIKSADFFNINIEQDIPKFIQPYTVEILNTETARQCNEVALDFFNTVHKKLLANKYKEALTIFGNHLNEPKENCLGYASNTTNGKGLRDLAANAMRQILDQPHLINEIEHIADLQLYVEQIMNDRISDLYTNVVRNVLNNYTLEQCKKHNMGHLIKSVTFGSYWDNNSHSWVEGSIKEMMVINNKPIILVPQSFLRGSFNPNTLYRNIVLTDLIKEDLIKNTSSLIKQRKNGERYISKKDKNLELRKNNYVPSKKSMVEFSKSSPNCTKRLRKILEENRNKRSHTKQKRKS